jgi:hypothetical protein
VEALGAKGEREEEGIERGEAERDCRRRERRDGNEGRKRAKVGNATTQLRLG